MVLALFLAGTFPPVAAAPANVKKDCSLSRPGVVLEYSGECRDGRIHGVAEVLLQFTNPRGGQTRAREFGWFQLGVAQGIHVLVLAEPDKPGSQFAAVYYFDATGASGWYFALATSQWPRKGSSLLEAGPWQDVDGRARKAGFDYAAATRTDGTVDADLTPSLEPLIYQLVESSMAEGVQTIDPYTLREFLRTLPGDKPLAGVRAKFPARAMFPDSGEPAPTARAAPPPVATPGLDELIRRANGGGK